MNSNVYHVHFLDHQLPEDDQDKAQFAREYAVELTGASLDDITCFMQKHAGDPSYRLTISVPQRLADAISRVSESGLEPVFEEPEKPYVDGVPALSPARSKSGISASPLTHAPFPITRTITRKGKAQWRESLLNTCRTYPMSPETFSTGITLRLMKQRD